jgi:hypothetical protein
LRSPPPPPPPWTFHRGYDKLDGGKKWDREIGAEPPVDAAMAARRDAADATPRNVGWKYRGPRYDVHRGSREGEALALFHGCSRKNPKWMEVHATSTGGRACCRADPGVRWRGILKVGPASIALAAGRLTHAHNIPVMLDLIPALYNS